MRPRLLCILIALLAAPLAGGCAEHVPPAPVVLPPASLPANGQALSNAFGVHPVDHRPAPDITLPLLSGDSLRLRDYRGRVVLVNFWATWCPPCRAEIPDLKALHTDLEPQGLTVLGIALDEQGAEAVQPFADAMDIPYPIGLDDGTAADAFGGVFGLPMSFVIDADGAIVQRVLGIFPIDTMRPVLLDLLSAAASTSHDS